MDNRTSLKAGLILNIFIIAFAVYGVLDLWLFPNPFFDGLPILHFAVLCAIGTALICLITGICQIRVLFHYSYQTPNGVLRLKYICTVAETVVFLLFCGMRLPQMIAGGDADFLLIPGNLALYVLVPLLTTISFFASDWRFEFRKATFLLALAIPLLYFILCMVLSVLPGEWMLAISGEIYKIPYAFLDYRSNGWFSLSPDVLRLGTFYWVFAIGAAAIIIGRIYLAILRHIHRGKLRARMKWAD